MSKQFRKHPLNWTKSNNVRQIRIFFSLSSIGFYVWGRLEMFILFLRANGNCLRNLIVSIGNAVYLHLDIFLHLKVKYNKINECSIYIGETSFFLIEGLQFHIVYMYGFFFCCSLLGGSRRNIFPILVTNTLQIPSNRTVSFDCTVIMTNNITFFFNPGDIYWKSKKEMFNFTRKRKKKQQLHSIDTILE